MEKKTKVIPMGGENREKISYEQLEKVAKEMSYKLNETNMKLNQAEAIINTFRRLDYLFKIVEHLNVYSKDFADNCIKEIESLMTIPEEEVREDK